MSLVGTMPQSDCLHLYATTSSTYVATTGHNYFDVYNRRTEADTQKNMLPSSDPLNDYEKGLSIDHADENRNIALKKTPMKRVTFADSVGLELENIRHITAGRDTPPHLCTSFLTSLNKSAEKELAVSLSLNFTQPISNYISFKERLSRTNLSLESVSLKGCSVIGTIKVRNLSFKKAVFIRVTTDDWKTQMDHPAYFVNNGLATNPWNTECAIDTFSFQFDVPHQRTNRVQFAVCFQCSVGEFWDNNNGENYCVRVLSAKSALCGMETEQEESTVWTNRFNDHKDQDNWTQFASWSRADSSVPYW